MAGGRCGGELAGRGGEDGVAGERVKLEETRCRLVEDANFLVPQFFEAYF
jgi:hypothetical protein